MIDIHCHLDLYPDPQKVVERCSELNLYMLSVTTVPSAFEGTAALAVDHTRIRTALGLHPELAAARRSELPLFETLLSRTRYVGEVGLDGSRDHRASLGQQIGVLADILMMCSRAGGRVVSLHSRGATKTLLDVVEACPAAGEFILHWYVGSRSQVSRASEMGCWFSVGPTMLTSSRGRLAVATMPRNRILPESDGPVALVNGRRAYPWEAWSIVSHFAQLWNESQAEVEGQLLSNFKDLAEIGSKMGRGQ